MKNCEILAPAGSFDALVAAVRSGCGAVYLGGKAFSARTGAQNFNNDELKRAIDYCHARDVRVYVAINTIIADHELNAALEHALNAVSMRADAIILQSPGLAELIKKHAPGARLHGSTQMSVHTPAGAQLLKDAGFDRVVLSRELSREEIAAIREICDIELEVFVHGALCMCVSGQCYMSAFLGGRSGNRGDCAQPCRLPFSVKGGTGHDLSLKDLSLLSELNELKKLGINSFKIEGRMKRPEYVSAAVTAAANSLKNGFVSQKDIEQLEAVFSRSGFTKGYYENKLGKDMFGTRKKENVQSASEKLLSDIRQIYKNEKQNIPVSFRFSASKGTRANLCVTDSHNNTVCVSGNPIQRAKTTPTTREGIEKQLRKTGGTPFFASEIFCKTESDIFIPVSEINSLRKRALEELLDMRAKTFNQHNSVLNPPFQPAFSKNLIKTEEILQKVDQKLVKTKEINENRLIACFQHSSISPLFRNFFKIFLPVFTPITELLRLKDDGFDIGLALPRGMFSYEFSKDEYKTALSHGLSPQEQRYINILASARDAGIVDVLAQNLGGILLGKKLGLKIHGGFGLNVSNTEDLRFFSDLDLEIAALSPELGNKAIRNINNAGLSIKTSSLVYGYFPVMLTRNCPAKNGKSCLGCQKDSSCDAKCGGNVLTDRLGKRFFIEREDSCCNILNSVPTYNLENIDKIHTDYYMLLFGRQDHEAHEEIYKMLKNRQPFNGKFTRGCGIL